MNLPENFSFSQQNLQDYSDCRYRFLLKYVHGIEWPAVESEPVLLQEARMELGQQFHRLVQQHFSGVDQSLLGASIQSPELGAWWQEFTTLDLTTFPGEKYAEKTISIPFNGYRLTAKYDLLVIEPGRKFTIYDWKTSAYLPKETNLLGRLQSIVYPYVLCKSITDHQEAKDMMEEIEMIYWFPAHPARPIRFQYSNDRFLQDGDLLTGLVNEIVENDEGWFNRTSDQSRCRYCNYRSHCGRGINAGVIEPGLDEFLDESAFDLDFNAL